MQVLAAQRYKSFMPTTTTRPRGTSRDPKKLAIGDDAVLARTGRDWAQWFKLVDAAGGKHMSHREIVAVVTGAGASPWWQQMVAVVYEQSRGLREKHQTPAGFKVGASKTIAGSADTLFSAWFDPRRRAKWLPESAGMAIRTSTPAKSLRITWTDGVTHVEVNFTSKGDRKCQVAVEHRKLPDARAAARMQRQWSAALGRLAALVAE